MNDEYLEVPSNILTGKDLDYLSDIFSWNYGALKQTNSSIESASDEEIIELLESASAFFENNLNSVLDILNEIGGITNGQ